MATVEELKKELFYKPQHASAVVEENDLDVEVPTEEETKEQKLKKEKTTKKSKKKNEEE